MNWLAVLDDLEAFARTGEHHPHEWVVRFRDIREEYEVEMEALKDELVREHADAVRAARNIFNDSVKHEPVVQPPDDMSIMTDGALNALIRQAPEHAPIVIEDALPEPPPSDPQWIGPKPPRRKRSVAS